MSAGLTFTYGVVRILNLAHGNLYALGAYMGAWLVLGWGSSAWPALSYLLLLLAAVFIGVTAGPVIERLFLRRVYGKEEEIQILLTFSILLILEDVIKLAWGVSPLFADKPYTSMGVVRLGGVDYAGYPFVLTGIATVTGLLLWLVVTRTQVSVYANGGADPDLVVQRLGDVLAGPVALWVGNNSRGDFAELKVTPSTSMPR